MSAHLKKTQYLQNRMLRSEPVLSGGRALKHAYEKSKTAAKSSSASQDGGPLDPRHLPEGISASATASAPAKAKGSKAANTLLSGLKDIFFGDKANLQPIVLDASSISELSLDGIISKFRSILKGSSQFHESKISKSLKNVLLPNAWSNANKAAFLLGAQQLLVKVAEEIPGIFIAPVQNAAPASVTDLWLMADWGEFENVRAQCLSAVQLVTADATFDSTSNPALRHLVARCTQDLNAKVSDQRKLPSGLVPLIQHIVSLRQEYPELRDKPDFDSCRLSGLHQWNHRLFVRL